MKKNIFLLLTLLCIGVLSSCSKEDDINKELAEWKLKNEQALNDLDKSIYKAIESSKGTVYYKEITKGEGKKLDANSRVKAYYRGYFYDKIPFDGNVSDKWELPAGGKPLKVSLNPATADYDRYTNPDGYIYVIDGWILALQAMSVGDKWEVWIPYALGYGANGVSGIPGYSTLVFEMEVIEAE